MNPWKVSAQFAAFVWYVNHRGESRAKQAEAARFARQNWIAFLPYAHEGYGRLLIRIARRKPALRPRSVPFLQTTGDNLTTPLRLGDRYQFNRVPATPEQGPSPSQHSQ